MYRDNIGLISNLFEQQSQTNGRSAWDTFKALFSSGLQHAQALLPGKLMVPLDALRPTQITVGGYHVAQKVHVTRRVPPERLVAAREELAR